MARFKDAQGREWVIGFTLGNLPKVREAGFNVSATVKNTEGFNDLNDPETFGRVLWVLCGDQADRAGITQESFADGFDGPTIHAAADSIMEAVADFYHRPAVAEAIRKKLPGMRAEQEAEMIRSWSEQTTQTAPIGSNGGVGNSPEALASTPAG